MKQSVSGRGIDLLIFLVCIAVVVPAIQAAGIEHDSRYQSGISSAEIGTINNAEINETSLEKYQEPPEPVTVFKAEVHETSLPGPRYMAFGPAAIALSVSPDIFSALVVTASLCVTAWCITAIGRWGRGE